jgi:hypothetical protein
MIMRAEAFMSPSISLRSLTARLSPAKSCNRRTLLVAGIRMSSSPTASKPDQDEYSEGIEKVRSGNSQLLPHFNTIRNGRFFRYYAVDLLSSCTYFPTIELPCEMAKCDVETAEDVPDDMRERDQREHVFALDGWVRWDMPGERAYPQITALMPTCERVHVGLRSFPCMIATATRLHLTTTSTFR